MWLFRRKKEQRSMTLDEFMALAGT
ncbi:hypothetical protein ODR30_28980, partial [Escherichia coli]|nr:hypothetical protein [Escherichia coli]